MAREEHEVTFRFWLEPNEHPEEAAAWTKFVQRCQQLLGECAADPELAALEIDPDFSLDISHW